MLTEPKIRNAKPKEKAYKLTDGAGLYLLSPRPARSRAGAGRFDYRFAGRRKPLSFGTYPDVTLKDARDDARKLVAAGTDPGVIRKAEKAAGSKGTFRAVAIEWHGKQSALWDPGHAKEVIRRLERNFLPWIGNRPVKAITASELLALLRSIESRDAIEAAHRAHQTISQVMRYAVATGRAERDPSADLKGAARQASA